MRTDTVHDNTTFVLATVSIFSLSSLLLFMVGFVPEPHVNAQEPTMMLSGATSTDVAPQVVAAPISRTPVRVVIPDAGIDVSVVTPESSDPEVLDRALLTGAVHYPGSRLAGENGTMLLFGHSSYLPVVHNNAYRTFNGIGKLKNGALIVVYTSTDKFVYAVEAVELARAADVTVEFNTPTPELVLSTCNVFGAKEERYVVTARLVSASAVGGV